VLECRTRCHGHRSTSKEQQRRRRLNWESNQVRGTAIKYEENISTVAGAKHEKRSSQDSTFRLRIKNACILKVPDSNLGHVFDCTH
jgi:hypothetical protein